MKYPAVLILLIAACSGATTEPEPSVTVLVGAYSAISINGNALPVMAAPAGDGSKQEIIAERLWLSGTVGYNTAVRRTVVRTTRGSTVSVDSVTMTGTFYPTLATAQTSFGPVTAKGDRVTLNATDGTIRVYQRVPQ